VADGCLPEFRLFRELILVQSRFPAFCAFMLCCKFANHDIEGRWTGVGQKDAP